MSGARVLVALAIVSAALPSAARASCAPRFSMPTPSTVARLDPQSAPSTDGPTVPGPGIESPERRADRLTVVGLWRVTFLVNGEPFDEAFDAWEAGGIEILNDAQAPATGNVCLGIWRQTGVRTFAVTHPGWNFDVNGTLTGSFVAGEAIALARDGRTYRGSISFEFFDVSGSLVDRLTGEVRAERVPFE